jgi:hypothetical protein
MGCTRGTHVRDHGPGLAELATTGTARIVGAMYNLETGLVEFFG